MMLLLTLMLNMAVNVSCLGCASCGAEASFWYRLFICAWAALRGGGQASAGSPPRAGSAPWTLIRPCLLSHPADLRQRSQGAMACAPPPPGYGRAPLANVPAALLAAPPSALLAPDALGLAAGPTPANPYRTALQPPALRLPAKLHGGQPHDRALPVSRGRPPSVPSPSPGSPLTLPPMRTPTPPRTALPIPSSPGGAARQAPRHPVAAHQGAPSWPPTAARGTATALADLGSIRGTRRAPAAAALAGAEVRTRDARASSAPHLASAGELGVQLMLPMAGTASGPSPRVAPALAAVRRAAAPQGVAKPHRPAPPPAAAAAGSEPQRIGRAALPGPALGLPGAGTLAGGNSAGAPSQGTLARAAAGALWPPMRRDAATPGPAPVARPSSAPARRAALPMHAPLAAPGASSGVRPFGSADRGARSPPVVSLLS